MRCKLASYSPCLYSLRISAIFNHFGYPSPQLDQWQQCIWYDLGATQELLQSIHNQLAKGLPAAASPPRVKPSSSSFLPTSPATCPTLGGKFIKASKGGGPPQNAATAEPSSAVMVTPPETEVKKRKKKRRATPRCTVTSETIPVVEKRPRVVPESPDSEAEGPFRDSDHTVSTPENSPNTPQ